MSELKFECPFCKQHIAAERMSAGFRFPCPTCQESICVPMDDNPFAQAALEPNPEDVPLTERERQIAEARKTHPVSLYPIMKPRLSYILNGELAESDLKPTPEPEAKGPPPAQPDIKTFNE